MTDTPQPTSGSLEARIIRACETHANKCPLDCRYRKVEEMGEIASFDTRQQSSRWWIVEQMHKFFSGGPRPS